MIKRLAIGLLILTAVPSPAAARKILVIGDSQSEEYAFLAGPSPGFSGPDSAPTTANIRNWVEILAAERPGDVSFGSYKPNIFGYSDLRNGGYANNWGVPSFTTGQFVDVIQSTILSNFLYYTSKNQIIDQLKTEVAYVAVFLGANDVRSRYGDYYNNTLPAGYNASIVANLKTLVDFIQAQKSSLRIVVVNIPDPGVTPSKIADHPNAAKRAAASTIIAGLNQSIATMAAAENCALADAFALTEQIRTGGAFFINGTEFFKSGHPENPPRYLFAKDGFHPSTVGQAHFANAIIAAINTRWNQSIPLLTNRELLGDVLGLHPDQPLHDWLAANGAAVGKFDDDADGDGADNGLEFALGTDPGRHDLAIRELASALRSGIPSLVLRYPGVDSRHGYLQIGAMESTRLTDGWSMVPAHREAVAADGSYEAWMPVTGPAGFLRLVIRPSP